MIALLSMVYRPVTMNFLLSIIILHAIILCHVDIALGQVSSKTSYVCPTICNCPDETSLHCQHADLSRIPSTSTETTILYVVHKKEYFSI